MKIFKKFIVLGLLLLVPSLGMAQYNTESEVDQQVTNDALESGDDLETTTENTTSDSGNDPRKEDKPGFKAGMKKAGGGVKDAGKATGRGLKKGLKKTGRAFKKAGKATGRGISKVGQAIQRSFSKKGKSDDVQEEDI